MRDSNGDSVRGALAGGQHQEQHRTRRRLRLALLQRWGSMRLTSGLLVLLLVGRPAASTESLPVAGASTGAQGSQQRAVAADPLGWGAGVLRRLLGQGELEPGSGGDGGGGAMVGADDSNNSNTGRKLAEDNLAVDKG